MKHLRNPTLYRWEIIWWCIIKRKAYEFKPVWCMAHPGCGSRYLLDELPLFLSDGRSDQTNKEE